MSIPQEKILQAWIRSNGKCECKCTSHHHGKKQCNQELKLEYNGWNFFTGWRVYKVWEKGYNCLSNFQILCYKCYKQKRRFNKNKTDLQNNSSHLLNHFLR